MVLVHTCICSYEMLPESFEAEGEINDAGVPFESVAAQFSDRKLLVNGRQFEYYGKAGRSKPWPSLCFLKVFHPCGRVALALSILTTVVDLTYTAFLVPLSVAFSKETLGEGWNSLAIADLLGNIVYAADLLLGFHIGFVVQWDARCVTITDGRLVAWWYIRHGPFLVNLIALMPVFMQIGLSVSHHNAHYLLHWVYLLRLLRLTRVWSLIQALSHPGEKGMLSSWVQGWMPQVYILTLNAFLSLLILLNLLGCIWWDLARWQGIQDSWAVQVESTFKTDLSTATDPVRYLFSVYYVMTTLTTIGYGDISPYTTLEVGVALVYMMIGVAYFGYLINLMSALLEAAQPRKRAAALQEKMRSLDGWMEGRVLPAALRRRLRTYFLERWMQQSETEEAILYAELPSDLKAQVRAQLCNERTSGAKQLPQLSQSTRAKIMAAIHAEAVPINLFPGHVLYRKGANADHFFVLDDGVMSASSSTLWPASVFSGPAVIGIAALFGSHIPDCAHHAQTLTAVNGCHLWSVDCTEVGRRLLDRHPEALLELATVLAQRLKSLLALSHGRLDSSVAVVAAGQRQQQMLGRLEGIAQGLDAVVVTLEGVTQFRQRLLQRLGSAADGVHRAFSTGWADLARAHNAPEAAATAAAVAGRGGSALRGAPSAAAAAGAAAAAAEGEEGAAQEQEQGLGKATSTPTAAAALQRRASAPQSGGGMLQVQADTVWGGSARQANGAQAAAAAGCSHTNPLPSAPNPQQLLQSDGSSSTAAAFQQGLIRRSSPAGSLEGGEDDSTPGGASPQATRKYMAGGFSHQWELLSMEARQLVRKLEMHDVLLAHGAGGEGEGEGERLGV